MFHVIDNYDNKVSDIESGSDYNYSGHDVLIVGEPFSNDQSIGYAIPNTDDVWERQVALWVFGNDGDEDDDAGEA